jgi:hypothetical protein
MLVPMITSASVIVLGMGMVACVATNYPLNPNHSLSIGIVNANRSVLRNDVAGILGPTLYRHSFAADFDFDASILTCTPLATRRWFVASHISVRADIERAPRERVVLIMRSRIPLTQSNEDNKMSMGYKTEGCWRTNGSAGAW